MQRSGAKFGRLIFFPARGVCASALFFIGVFISPVWSAEVDPALPNSAQAKDPLASKQQIVRDRMTQLEDRMFRLSEKLNKSEPDQAKRLTGALHQSRELLIRRNMDETIELIEAGKFTDAADHQGTITKDLERVLKLLLEDPDNTEERQKEIDRLKEFREKVEKLLDEERKLKALADAAPRLEQLLAAVQAAIVKLQAMMERQQKAIEKTTAAEEQDNKPAVEALTEEQKQIRLETESLAENLSRPLATPSESEKPDDAKPPSEKSDASENSPNSEESDASDASKAAGEKNQSPKSSTEKFGDKPEGAEQSPSVQTKPAEQKDESSEAAERKEESESPDAAKEKSDKDAQAPPEAAIESGMRKAGEDVNKAGGEMQSAEKELGRKDLKKTVPEQKKALESLKRALDQLKKQEAVAKEQLNQAEAARKQRELKELADKLAEQMEKQPQEGSPKPSDAPKEGEPKEGQPQDGKPQDGKPQEGKSQEGKPQEQQEGQPGEPKSGEDKPQENEQQPTPGQQNVKKAGKHMDDAAEDLDKENPKAAGEDEKKAIEELEKAQQQLEEALEQLRKEQQEEILRGLESRFRAMLAQQLVINKGTDDLIVKTIPAWTHADELALAGLSKKENTLAEEAGAALLILTEDGTTIVFPKIVAQLQQDMLDVAGRLGEKLADDRTQRMEADLVNALKELIDAIKKMRKELQDQNGPSGGGGSGPGNDPLLPNSAELKLLRSCQDRVNRQTLDLQDEVIKAPQAPGQKEKMDKLADRQREVAEMARKMNERITGQ